MENQEQAKDENVEGTRQISIWGALKENGDNQERNVFALNPEEEHYRQMIGQHKAWLASIRHECPSPEEPYRIGVYIRFFNQTKYENYLDYHKQQFIDTIRLCPKWTLVDFYVDEGQTAPNMENAPGWTRLLEACFSGKVNLIITQKISNVSRKPRDLAFISRILATLQEPVGIYFISDDLFTLASYYQQDLRDTEYLPSPDWQLLPETELEQNWIGDRRDDT